MFTGLIESIGRVLEIRRQGAAASLVIGANALETVLGDSISVDGACLTVRDVSAGRLTFDVSPETLSRTTLAAARPGDPVNLERAMIFGSRVGGHLVTGHVDGIGRIADRRAQGEIHEIQVVFPPDLTPEIAEKGSIAVDGVSLTVADLSGDRFRVALIPFTLQNTTLGDKKGGAEVNLETDILAKYIRRGNEAVTAAGKDGRIAEKLEAFGFLKRGGA